MNATAYFASLESLSKVGTFQIVGWPRYVLLYAPNMKQSPSICETVLLDLWHCHAAYAPLWFSSDTTRPILSHLIWNKIAAPGFVSPWCSWPPCFRDNIFVPKWALYCRPVDCDSIPLVAQAILAAALPVANNDNLSEIEAREPSPIAEADPIYYIKRTGYGENVKREAEAEADPIFCWNTMYLVHEGIQKDQGSRIT
jgi:hypothetical protein